MRKPLVIKLSADLVHEIAVYLIENRGWYNTVGTDEGQALEVIPDYVCLVAVEGEQ